MARLMPPQRISFTQSAWNVAPVGGFFTTAAVSWNAGDVLVAVCGVESQVTLGTPGATGLTFTVQKSNSTLNTCTTSIATAVAAASGSQAVSVSTNNSSQHGGIGVWVIRGSDGVGNSVEQHTAIRTVALTPTDAHSMICYATFDFAAVALVSPTPTPTTAEQALRDTTHYTIYVDNLADQPAAGATSYGVGGTGVGPFSIVAIEIKGTLEKKLWTPNRPMSQAVHRGAFR